MVAISLGLGNKSTWIGLEKQAQIHDDCDQQLKFLFVFSITRCHNVTDAS